MYVHDNRTLQFFFNCINQANQAQRHINNKLYIFKVYQWTYIDTINPGRIAFPKIHAGVLLLKEHMLATLSLVTSQHLDKKR